MPMPEFAGDLRRSLLAPVVLLIVASGCFGPSDPFIPQQAGGASHAFPLFKSALIDPDHRGSEPSTAIAPDGTIFVCSPVGLGGGTNVWVSVDGGATFHYSGTPLNSSLPVLPFAPVFRSGSGDVGGGDCDVSVDAGDRVYLADLWQGGISVSSSTDRGATWRGVPVSIPVAPLDRPWIVGGKKDEVFLTAAQFQGAGLDDKGLATPPVGGI